MKTWPIPKDLWKINAHFQQYLYFKDCSGLQNGYASLPYLLQSLRMPFHGKRLDVLHKQPNCGLFSKSLLKSPVSVRCVCQNSASFQPQLLCEGF